MQHDIYATLGASNHSNEERDPNDYYATDPKAIDLLLDEYGDEINLGKGIWEPAAGGGHLAEALRKRGHYVYASDVVDHGYEYDQLVDFFAVNNANCMDIVTNPPYCVAKEFVEHALEVIDTGRKVLMFLKVTFLESKKRKELFEKYPPPRNLCIVKPSTMCQRRQFRQVRQRNRNGNRLCVVSLGEGLLRRYCGEVV